MYKLKEEKVIDIKKTYKLQNIAENIGITRTYLSNILSGRPCKKTVAYSLVKYINNEAEILDYFEVA